VAGPRGELRRRRAALRRVPRRGARPRRGRRRPDGAALASSAFPGVFPAVRHEGADGVARTCVDGGLIANDPCLVAYAEALAAGGGRDIVLVSLGTGVASPPEPDPAALAAAAAPKLVRDALRRALGDRYARVQTELDAPAAFDDASRP
jgi:predicted acylesterase/phospholipase RssA